MAILCLMFTPLCLPRQLEEAGLVEDFSVIDTYLCSNGYSTKIRAGTFEIAPGMSVEELVKIITKEK